MGDIETWNDAGRFDVILASAVLQGVPDRASVLPALANWYYDLLRRLATKVDIWRTTYHHLMPAEPRRS